MAHSSELECPQHGNMSIWATMHSEVESLFQLFIHDHSALQLTLSCDGIKNREHHMTGIPRYITADTLTPPPPIKRELLAVGGGREREKERERKKKERKKVRKRVSVREISLAPFLSHQSSVQILSALCGAVHDPLLQHMTKHPKPDHQPCLLITNGKSCFLFNVLRTKFSIANVWRR